jgi:hypothetical protein
VRLEDGTGKERQLVRPPNPGGDIVALEKAVCNEFPRKKEGTFAIPCRPGYAPGFPDATNELNAGMLRDRIAWATAVLSPRTCHLPCFGRSQGGNRKTHVSLGAGAGRADPMLITCEII